MKRLNLIDLISDKKVLSVLVDPDYIFELKLDLSTYFNQIKSLKPDLLLIGGSLLSNGDLENSIKVIKEHFEDLPLYLFPGNNLQLTNSADGILYLSLISGRNPDFLIGQHVQSAFQLKRMNIEVVPTGYMLIECGKQTTAEYISNTKPIPYNKSQIAASTALAGEYLGLQTIYLDGGSGAEKSISLEMIKNVKKEIVVPLIVGGGIKSYNQVEEFWEAGANMVVVGTSIERGSFNN